MAKAAPGESNAEDLFGFLAGEVKIIEAKRQKQLQIPRLRRAPPPRRQPGRAVRAARWGKRQRASSLGMTVRGGAFNGNGEHLPVLRPALQTEKSDGKTPDWSSA